MLEVRVMNGCEIMRDCADIWIIGYDARWSLLTNIYESINESTRCRIMINDRVFGPFSYLPLLIQWTFRSSSLLLPH